MLFDIASNCVYSLKVDDSEIVFCIVWKMGSSTTGIIPGWPLSASWRSRKLSITLLSLLLQIRPEGLKACIRVEFFQGFYGEVCQFLGFCSRHSLALRYNIYVSTVAASTAFVKCCYIYLLIIFEVTSSTLRDSECE